MAIEVPAGVEINGAIKPGFETVLTPEALAFVVDLQRRFDPRREELLAARVERQKELDAGELPDFLPETANIRNGDWKVAPAGGPARPPRRDHRPGRPQDGHQRAQLRRATCSWPTSRTPTRRPGRTCIDGQVNLRDAVRRTITFTEPERQAATR